MLIRYKSMKIKTKIYLCGSENHLEAIRIIRGKQICQTAGRAVFAPNTVPLKSKKILLLCRKYIYFYVD